MFETSKVDPAVDVSIRRWTITEALPQKRSRKLWRLRPLKQKRCEGRHIMSLRCYVLECSRHDVIGCAVNSRNSSARIVQSFTFKIVFVTVIYIYILHKC